MKCSTRENLCSMMNTLNVYQNIQKSGLYSITSGLSLISYTDENKSMFSHLDNNSCIILDENKHPIVSLKTEDIHNWYNTPILMYPLNVSLMYKFNMMINNKWLKNGGKKGKLSHVKVTNCFSCTTWNNPIDS
jgi:hypothetical protein